MKPAMPGDHRAIVAWIGRVIQSFPSSIVIGETYRLIEPSINDIIPVKVLYQKDETLWLGVRSDMPEAYVEIRWKRS